MKLHTAYIRLEGSRITHSKQQDLACELLVGKGGVERLLLADVRCLAVTASHRRREHALQTQTRGTTATFDKHEPVKEVCTSDPATS